MYNFLPTISVNVIATVRQKKNQYQAIILKHFTIPDALHVCMCVCVCVLTGIRDRQYD